MEPGSARSIGRLGLAAAAILAAPVLIGCSGSHKDKSGGSSASSTSASPGGSGGSGTGSSGGTKSGGTSSSSGGTAGSSQSGQQTKSPVPASQTASFGGNVTATITSLKSITAKATLPGEIAGPAVAVSVKLVNASAKSVNTSSAVVNLFYGSAKTPGSPVSSAPGHPFPASVGKGKTMSAVYVFDVPKADQPQLVIYFSYTPGAPAVQFTGAAS